MAKKKSDKKIECFSASFNNILICQKDEAKPFIEAFVEEPENITQQNLGILAGILEITDESEDSSYIVNYLISVIKKEYYSKPKRGVIESFESALKKANLALAKLAEHENIAWIGKTNAILLVIDKNNLHLSTSGTARALLLRGKTLIDISEDPTSVGTPNPIKTFTDIVSGRLEEQDKLIITTEAMFDLFSLEEIKRSALKFSSSEFIQFLKTALVNESELAAALIIEIKKEIRIKSKPVAQKNSVELNAFSQSAFSKKLPAKAPLGISAETFAGTVNLEEKDPSAVSANERETLVNEIKKELAKNNGEFVDKKTGHIYIKENSQLLEEPSDFLEALGLWQDKLRAYSAAFFEFLKSLPQKGRLRETLRVSASSATPASSDKNELLQKSISIPVAKKIEKLKNILLSFVRENYPGIKNFLLVKLAQLVAITKNIWQKMQSLFLQIYLACKEKSRRARIAPMEKLNTPEKSTARPETIIPKVSVAMPLNASPASTDWLEKRYQKRTFSNDASQSFSAGKPQLKKIVPDFSRLRNIFFKMDYSQKLYAALAIIFLFIVPYFLAKIGAKPVPKVVTPQAQETAHVELPLEQDKNVTRVDNVTTVYTGAGISTLINLDDSVFAVSPNGIVDVANNANYPFPDNFTPKESAGMDDINFIFFLGQNNQILSWSPAAKKFQGNTITLPAETKIASIGTYLTYLYTLDSAGNQIYRYPRSDGGFGEKTAWLKDTADLASVQNMAIGENIYLGTTRDISKFFQGKKQVFTLEESATPIQIDALYTHRDGQFLYILDKANARIIKTDLDGKIVTQTYNAEIKNATAFTVDEKNNLVYVSTAEKVGTVPMN